MKVALHALRPEIEAGLAAQKPVIMIYDELKDRIPSGYEWFRQFVAREITGKAGSRGGRVPAKANPAPETRPSNSTHPLPLPDASAPAPTPERIEPRESSEYQPRKFTDFGNLESTLDRWYPPKDRKEDK
ncbi:hypothetical protein [Acidocella aminolytica]|uniref:Uncharacterized protein n=1 Tax=Acidocella aminolytica 101 = DSM 11237 TaxID=1120923 RepID=A0A0D6PF74_9PROT|nr:hypothetical protein [Acidocella aminolytica]GAN80400.1 hypothetical protein Aam_046_041 [Acidocella aminolytica 101 = DSM 11237]SHF44814.1 hypothetical protein SAMN02746095_03297 [Acidocella aminolytica 101 = DSM 11237]